MPAVRSSLQRSPINVFFGSATPLIARWTRKGQHLVGDELATRKPGLSQHGKPPLFLAKGQISLGKTYRAEKFNGLNCLAHCPALLGTFVAAFCG